MSDGLILALYVAGVGLLFLELFTPGLVAGIAGAGCLGVSIYFLFENHGALAGGAGLAIAAGVTVAVARYGLRRLVQKEVQDAARYSVANPATAALAGAEGVALSPLRPSGVVRLDGAHGGRRIDVVTRGEMIEAGAAVRVVEVDGNRVIVQVK